MNNSSEPTTNAESVFRCPGCGAGLPVPAAPPAEPCVACGFQVSFVENVPLLVKDRAVIESRIQEAKSAGRASWYEDPHDAQLTGPYRHHVRKRKQYVDTALSAFCARTKQPLRALDLGCGDGNNIDVLHRHFAELFISDYNLLRLLRAARKPGAARAYLADVLDYPTVAGAFDAIFFNHVIEHIPDDLAALREVYRILKPGGLVILGAPNEGAAFWRLAYTLDPATRAASDHVHFYTAESLAGKCEQAGFSVSQVHHIGWGVPHWRLDSLVRGYKIVDDLFEKAGRALFKSQATSLYLLLTK